MNGRVQNCGLYLRCSRSARPLPRGGTGHVAQPTRSIDSRSPDHSVASPCDPCSLPGGVPARRVAKLVFWAIVGRLRSQKYEGGKSTLRCAPKSVRRWCSVEVRITIMKADLVKAASEVITNQQILVNMVSRRVRP